jgi:phasin family protein
MNTQFDKYLAPLKELNELTEKNFADAAALQIKLVEENTKISMQQLQNARTISGVDSLQGYLGTQAEVAKQANKRFVENVRTITAMGSTYNNMFQQIVKNSTSA